MQDLWQTVRPKRNIPHDGNHICSQRHQRRDDTNHQYRCSGNGGPQTCLPAACGVAQGAAQHGPSSSTQTQDPREGQSLAGWTTRSFLRHGLIRLAREEAERSRRGTSRGARDASHDDQRRQAGASRVVSSFPLWCKGSKRRREHQAKAPVSVQRDQDQSNGRKEVTMEPRTASP